MDIAFTIITRGMTILCLSLVLLGIFRGIVKYIRLKLGKKIRFTYTGNDIFN